MVIFMPLIALPHSMTRATAARRGGGGHSVNMTTSPRVSPCTTMSAATSRGGSIQRPAIRSGISHRLLCARRSKPAVFAMRAARSSPNAGHAFAKVSSTTMKFTLRAAQSPRFLKRTQVEIGVNEKCTRGQPRSSESNSDSSFWDVMRSIQVLLQSLNDSNVAHGAIAKGVQRFLVGTAVIGGCGLLEAGKFGNHDALLEPVLVGRRGSVQILSHI